MIHLKLAFYSVMAPAELNVFYSVMICLKVAFYGGIAPAELNVFYSVMIRLKLFLQCHSPWFN